MFSLSRFSPTDSPTLLLAYKNPTFPGCIWSWAQSLSGITECHYSIPTSVHHQWSTRMNTSLIESMRRTPHTICLNCGTHGGYSPIGSWKESPTSLSSHPSVYGCPHWVNTLESGWWQKYLFEEVARRSAFHNVLQSRDRQTVLWWGGKQNKLILFGIMAS